jgi:Uma2 family endonuclease
MSTALDVSFLTEDEYLQSELLSDIRHEYINGEIYAMVGATGEHSTIALNIATEFKLHLRDKPCRPFFLDMKVKVDTKYFYPDVLIDCAYDSANPHVSGGPVLIIEVLSDSTRVMDETTKYQAYRQIPSLQEYVLVEQKFAKVEVFQRNNNWALKRYGAGDDVTFSSVGLTLPIATIYERVETPDLLAWREQHNR